MEETGDATCERGTGSFNATTVPARKVSCTGTIDSKSDMRAIPGIAAAKFRIPGELFQKRRCQI